VDAAEFLTGWHIYCHLIDDIVDGDTPFTNERFLEVLMLANKVYSLPFYRTYAPMLSSVVAMVTNTYADSVEWEKSDEEYKRKVADVIRQCGNEMIYAVANICGGHTLMRKISLRLREAAYLDQH